MKKFTIVLPSFLYNATRVALAKATFASMAKTRRPEFLHRLDMLVKGDATTGEWPYSGGSNDSFLATLIPEPVGIGGTEQTLAWGATHAFEQGADYVVWMGDDALFHPDWLIQLDALIDRHPGARAWSVYHSSHTAFHEDLAFEGEDVRVLSVCGHGMTFSRQEWEDWGVNWQEPAAFTSPRGSTLDLHHPWKRPGDRWVTNRSFVEHTGRVGIHCNPMVPEWAQNFAGVN